MPAHKISTPRPVCSYDGCDNDSRNKGPGFCDAHYVRNWKHGNATANFSKAIAWDQVQLCTQCKREMRPNTSVNDGRPAHHGNGICRTCARENRTIANGTKRKNVIFDKNGQVCTTCKRYQSFDEFRKTKVAVLSGYNPTCKVCSRLWRYSITRNQYEELLSKQNHACAICKIDAKDLKQEMHIDHDHSCCDSKTKRFCGKCIRGILCADCNHGIARFRDNPDLLISASNFLKHTQPTAKEQL